MDAPAPAPDVGGLASVLLHVGPGDADTRAVGQVEPAADVERLVVLTDLVVLGHVRIEIVLPVEDRRLHCAMQSQPHPHGQLDGVAVEHRQRSGQAEAHRAHVGVRVVAEGVAAPTEQLGGRGQLAVDLEADHHLPVGADHSRHGARLRSRAAAARNMVASPRAGASSCTPTGSPSSPQP